MRSSTTLGMSQSCCARAAGARHLSYCRLPWAGAARPISVRRRSHKLSRTHLHCQVTRGAAVLERSDVQRPSEQDFDRSGGNTLTRLA